MEPGIRRARPVPLTRKLSSNGDDIFKWSSSSSSRSPSNPPKPSDYAEIFGGLAASCSIPVLDLPPPASTEDVFRTTTLDYFDIFGGFETAGFGVSYEELFFPPEDQRVTKQTEVHEQPTAVYESSEKEPKGNRIQLSSSGGRKKSNGSTGELDMSYQKPSCGTKESTVDGGIDAKELHAVPKFTFVDDACPPSHITKPDTLLVPVARSLDTTAESSGGVAGSNFRNIEPLTAPCTSTRSCDDLDSDSKLSETKLSPSEDNSANEQYHSCSSGNQSVIDGDDSLPDQSTTYEYSTTDTSGGIEENCFGKSASATSSSTSMKSSKEETRDDQIQCTMKSVASEKIPSFPHLHMHSNTSNNNSASSGDVTILGRSANGLNGGRTFCNQSTNYCSENPEFNTGEMDKKMPNKSVMPKSTIFTLKNAGNGLKEDHKQDNLFHAASEGPPMNSQPHERTSNNLSASIDDRSTPSNGTKFVTVSDINLQTQPSQVPPPSRPPPRVCNGQGPPKLRKAESMKTHSDKSGYRQATCRRTISLTGASETFKGTARNGSPPFFDVEVDVSSAAAASVAAMKEAMEQAQARLKSAKESMERKKDNLQGRKKSVLTEVSKSKEPKMDETIQAAQLFKQEMVLETDESYRSKRNAFANDQRQKSSGIDMVVSDLEANERYFDLAEESLRRAEGEDTMPSQVTYIQDARAGEWKVEEQFFELVNNSKKPTKVQEFHEHEAEKKKAKSHVKSNEEKTDEQTTNFAYELKKNDKSFAVDVGYDFRDRDDKLKKSKRVAEVEDKEAPKQIPEVSLLENEEGIEENFSAQLTEEDKKQQQDHVNVKQKPRTFEDAFMDKESEVWLNEASKVCLSDVFPECGFEELKSKSSKETHLTEKSEESHASKESEQVINASDKISVTKPDENSFISGREPSLENDTGIEEHTASQQKLSEEQSEDGNLAETMNSCEVICNHEEKEPILHEDMMLTKQDEGNLSMVQESCKLTESDKQTNEDCNKEQDERISNAVEESTPWPENNEENETKEGTCWQYFCEKIIRETQEELPQCDEKQTADKADDELNAQGNHEVGMDELEVAPDSQENSSTYVASQEGCQSANEMEREESEQANILDPPNNVQKAPQMVTERPDSEGNGKNIAEMLNTDERIREESVKIELEQEKERTRKLEEEKEREREREKDRLAFERASREARDRASAEAWERAERAAVERANAEARQRGLAEAREKAERASNEALLLAEKASREARLKAERAAVERATAEARERAVERALAEKAMKEARERAERSHSTYRDKQKKDLRDFPREQQRYSDSLNHGGRPEGESAMRCKARLERHQRTVERAAKALAEKNLRDILVQREQAERNRIAETLDADVRRWSNGKEGNLRALLSTLQYILGPESGWHPIPLTGIITAAAVKKAYRKATLCVHPDKLQQRGASIQQKYICEKVFDLLKDAWNGFNSEER